jgi:hypothetical protein
MSEDLSTVVLQFLPATSVHSMAGSYQKNMTGTKGINNIPGLVDGRIRLCC